MMDGICRVVKLSWTSFFSENRVETSLSLSRVPGQICHAARQRKYQNQGRAHERNQERGLERQPQPREIKTEGGLTDAEPVHRHGQHLDDERDRHDHGEIPGSDGDVERVCAAVSDVLAPVLAP